MMGRQSDGQKKLFYSFNLDDHVPSDHLLRGVDQFLDLGDLHQHLAPYYSHTGRPSIDPQLLIPLRSSFANPFNRFRTGSLPFPVRKKTASNPR
jgi:hypothetical protein